MKLPKIKLTFDEQNLIINTMLKFIISVGFIIAIASLTILYFSK